jgi:hypothetical protein
MDSQHTDQIQTLENRLKAIEARNARVEIDKKWETSVTRILAITVLTYLVMVALFAGLGDESPYSQATVPTAGFILSNCSLTILKKVWSKQHLKRLIRNGNDLSQ